MAQNIAVIQIPKIGDASECLDFMRRIRDDNTSLCAALGGLRRNPCSMSGCSLIEFLLGKTRLVLIGASPWQLASSLFTMDLIPRRAGNLPHGRTAFKRSIDITLLCASILGHLLDSSLLDVGNLRVLPARHGEMPWQRFLGCLANCRPFQPSEAISFIDFDSGQRRLELTLYPQLVQHLLEDSQCLRSAWCAYPKLPHCDCNPLDISLDEQQQAAAHPTSEPFADLNGTNFGRPQGIWITVRSAVHVNGTLAGYLSTC